MQLCGLPLYPAADIPPERQSEHDADGKPFDVPESEPVGESEQESDF